MIRNPFGAAQSAAIACAALCVLLGSCGYTGDPHPPALNIAMPIRDFRIYEYGDQLIMNFTIPPVTTEGLAMTKLKSVEIHVASIGANFDLGRWSAAGKTTTDDVSATGPQQIMIPVADWVGQDVVVGVRSLNDRGRPSDWSNVVNISVAAPVPRPTDLHGEETAHGEQLTWQSRATSFRVFRKGPADENPVPLATTTKPEYLDTTAQFGTTYEYVVQALYDTAQSQVSAPLTVTPKDKFAPATPTGLNVVAGAGSNELVWDRNTEPDLRGYVIYRSVDNGPMARLAEVNAPAYSDRDIQSGKAYAYATASVDQSNNESAKTAPVTVTAQ